MKNEHMLNMKIRAPDFGDTKEWINTKPLSIGNLNGKIILVDFWNYTSTESRKSVSTIKKWHKKYAKKDLVIIGVHCPEFEFEKDMKNVKNAAKKLGINYPIILDNHYQIWNKFENQYLPAHYLIDKKGYMIDVYFGDTPRCEIEENIQEQLDIKEKIEIEKNESYMIDQSQDIYAGFAKNFGLGSGLKQTKEGEQVYVDPGEHVRDIIYPSGKWEQEKDYLELKDPIGKITYVFYAREANIIMEPTEKTANVEIEIAGKKPKKILVDMPSSYNIFKSKKYKEQRITLTFNDKIKVYKFTFG